MAAGQHTAGLVQVRDGEDLKQQTSRGREEAFPRKDGWDRSATTSECHIQF